MFASQLLKILQTLPSDVKYESCVFDPAEQNMTLKENQNATFYDSKSFGRETDPLTFGTKEIYELNDSRMDTSPLTFEAKGRDECWNRKVVDDFYMDNENGTIDSPRKEDQNGLSHHLRGWEKDADSLPSDTYDKDKEQRSPEHKSSVIVEEFTHCNGNEFRDSSSPCNGASDLFETETNLYTDKNVLECELPELEVCYKEINYHIMKDICVDEGRAEKDKNLIESCKDDKSGHLFPQPPNDNNHSEATEASSLENADALTANQCGSKEENDGKLDAQGKLKSSSDKDTSKHCDPEDSVQTGEANCGATVKAANDSSEEDSLVDRKLPIQEYGTRSFLRSFLNSLDGEGNKVTLPPDQIPSGKEVSESPAASSAEAGGLEEDVQASSLLYNSKVESRSITFNFNSPLPVVVGLTSGVAENAKEQSVDLGDAHDHKDANADKLSDAGQVQCTSSSIGNVQEQSLIIKDGNSDGSSATSKDRIDENVHEQSPEHNDGNSDDFSKDGQVQFPSNKSRSSTNDDTRAVEPNVSKHEHRNSGNVSVLSQLQYDEGEASFSAASLVTYSGPIAYSGSLSHRSDGSATSGRSFAFPILQSEWNSSPVRMAKADRRHFRKHKGWRSGLLCCRF
ncbi:hypothetical protein Pfo_023869 [Paulownia fortunei]|nr:hypothetical protein Pfo_023869 [Paulownia fortunei]